MNSLKLRLQKKVSLSQMVGALKPSKHYDYQHVRTCHMPVGECGGGRSTLEDN
jgi:hypothetical protein